MGVQIMNFLAAYVSKDKNEYAAFVRSGEDPLDATIFGHASTESGARLAG
jgi:hypothetical protein